MDGSWPLLLCSVERVCLLLTLLGLPVTLAECEAPPEIDGSQHNLTVSPPFPETTVVSYDCAVGYQMFGSSRTYTCHESDWVGGDLECSEIICEFLDPPRNGYIANNPTYKINSIIEFGCHEGYDLSGPSSRRCMLDGWTSTETDPTCDVKMCDEFSGVANGQVFQESPDGVANDYGSEITITCDHGYVLSGASRVICGADGQWSQGPTCEESTCPLYPISTSNCTKKYRLIGTTYYLYCVAETEDVSVTRTGASSALCVNNQWTDESMACYCNCKVRADPDEVTLHNVGANGFLSHELILSWSCRKGGTKAVNVDLVCIDGVMADPSCIMPTTTSTTTSTTTKAPTTSTTTTTTSTSVHTPTTTAQISTSYTTASTSTASSVSVPFSTSSTGFVVTTVSKVIDLLTVSTTQPALQALPVCSCDCDVLEDKGIVEMFQKDEHVQLNKEWACSKRSEGDDFICRLQDFGVLSCRLNCVSQSGTTWTRDANLATRITLQEACKCRDLSKSRRNSAFTVDGANTLHIMFVLSVIRSLI